MNKKNAYYDLLIIINKAIQHIKNRLVVLICTNMKRIIKTLIALIFLITLCVSSYEIGVYSSRLPLLKDLPQYLKNFPKYKSFLELTNNVETLPSLSSIEDIPRYLNEYSTFEKLGGKITGTEPILYNYKESAGITNGCYFHQDLLVASFIYKSSPIKHIDIGSRFDGFVAHVASFRKIEVMDIRHSTDMLEDQNIYFTQTDLMDENNIPENITDSISSLHAIEHFGLGRYGDVIDPDGHIKGFNNILKMLKPKGIIYISFPIGKSNQVQFNSERIFTPLDIFNWAIDKNSLELLRFDYVDNKGNLHQNVDLKTKANDLDLNFGSCGIYTFRKVR